MHIREVGSSTDNKIDWRGGPIALRGALSSTETKGLILNVGNQLFLATKSLPCIYY